MLVRKRISNPALWNGGDFMVEMPLTKRNGSSASCSQKTMESTQEFHSDGNILTETSFLNGVFRWDPASESKLRLPRNTSQWCFELGLEKSSPVVTLVAKRPKWEELPLLAGKKPPNAEKTTLYKSVAMRVNYLSLDCPELSFAASFTKNEKLHDKKTSRNSNMLNPT